MVAEIIISIICIACAAFLWFVADKKGRNTLFWAIMGAVFGPFAIPLISVFHLDRFPVANPIITVSLSCFGFYLPSISLRIQNQRGRALTGKSLSKGGIIKFIFPVIGFVLGIALILFLPSAQVEAR